MASLLVIRLIPEKAISAMDFANYLTNLRIEASDATFLLPNGSAPPFGSADFLPPLPFANPILNPFPPEDPATRIAQHFIATLTFGGFYIDFKSVASAVIEIPTPAANAENLTADVLMKITRNGVNIKADEIYYNIPVVNSPLPGDPSLYPTLAPSLYFFLPAPGQEASTTALLPQNGKAPNYATLLGAMQAVLNNEPGAGNYNITNLNREQSQHIAHEIIWNSAVFPLPVPNRSLEDIYTGPHSATDDEERDRQMFEADLTTYFVKHNTESERLANFVFSLCAALWCNDKTLNAAEAGFYFPVFPLHPPSKEAKLILNGPGGILDPKFEVPAEYFYALTSILPPQIDREQRYRMCAIDAEEQNLLNLEQALQDNVFSEPAGINKFQAARRLRALSIVSTNSIPACLIAPVTPEHQLITDWLGVTASDLTTFWSTISGTQTTGHLNLMVCVVTRSHMLLMIAIKAPAFGLVDVDDLAAKTNEDWQILFIGNLALLPDFTKPGTEADRIQAFIRYLRKFFEVPNVFNSPGPTGSSLPIGLDRPPGNPLDVFLSAYKADAGVDFSFAGGNTTSSVLNALNVVFPGDPDTQLLFTDWLKCIENIIALTIGLPTPEMQFSVIEALWARGFTTAQNIEGCTFRQFQEALVGSVAYDFAAIIWSNAGVSEPAPPPAPDGFRAVNPDGSLVNCVPPLYLSPLGPVAYLHDLLRVSIDSTCANPIVKGASNPLSLLLSNRRGQVGDLTVSQVNLEIPVPLIDLVNESLEFMVATDSDFGVVYDTSADHIAQHELSTNHIPPSSKVLHDTVTLYEVLPEHSTPAITVAQQGAYDKLKNDFSSCVLPYNQPFDVSSTYLKQLGTSRFDTKRRFRKLITEFVIAPENEPAEFQGHLWRYPVRLDIALEYLDITPEEFLILFQDNIVDGPASGTKLALHSFYSFADENLNGKPWKEVVVQLPEFLKRTCLSYCEFISLWKSGFVKFENKNNQNKFDDCESCCLDKDEIVFIDPFNPGEALKRLIIFIRLWRKLKSISNAGYSFTELRDICEVLKLFDGSTLNLDFIRQLAAFQMFRDDFRLPLTNGTQPAVGDTGAHRMHILSFWDPAVPSSLLNWAKEQLLANIQSYAVRKHKCKIRGPEFIKLLQQNLDPLSDLAGFNPTSATNRWEALPTHTLRFAEVLTKIYASEFGIGEIIFLFTVNEHLEGDDPFALQTDEEAAENPFDLPDDEEHYSLESLRQKLLKIEAQPDQAKKWTWNLIETSLREDFALLDPIITDRWLSFGRHFFPSVLEQSGIAVSTLQKQYRTPLAGPTSESIWNTPADGPFRFDVAASELWTQIPLSDETILAKLSRIRQLNNNEKKAVRELYFLPQTDIAYFDFIFSNFGEAVTVLMSQKEESARWEWFQSQFEKFYQKVQVILDHLSGHIRVTTGYENPDGKSLALLVLTNLWADENMATGPWEKDNGQSPDVTFKPFPHGGALAAILGLTGTGLLSEFNDPTPAMRWREMHGGASFFDEARNSWNAPVPTIIPSLGLTFTSDQLGFAAVRNGFAMANIDGAMLGGAESFTLNWCGSLLIEKDGSYKFSAGAPANAGELPDFHQAKDTHRWRITLERGQKFWILLSYDRNEHEIPPDFTKPLPLKKGMYKLTIELERKAFVFERPENVCPQVTGFEVKYEGPDSADQWMVIPYHKLFLESKNATLKEGIDLFDGATEEFLKVHYTSSVRDIRRTYQRAFKALLFADRFHLSAKPIADDGQSELGYIITHPDRFAGQSYFKSGLNYNTHKANFNFNFLPVLDNFYPPPAAQDGRTSPSAKRRKALFDWWERIFDYSIMRMQSQGASEHPVWLLFHEAAELHPDDPAHLVRHLGVDIRHDVLVLRYYPGYDISINDLQDERWALRVWHAEEWIRKLTYVFLVKDIRYARPSIWASDDPVQIVPGETENGNQNLTMFYREGCIENKEPRRYKEIKKLNDQIRLRGKAALIAYLTHMDRVNLPWGGFATNARELGELLLMDIETGACEKASRIEEAITVCQLFIQRARLGIEPSFTVIPAFLLAWERNFSTFEVWKNCNLKKIYVENWIEWDQLHKAKETEAFQLMEKRLKSATLTLAAPGGLAYWQGPKLPSYRGLTLLQHREPSIIQLLDPAPEGLGLLGTPDRLARPSWLAPLPTKKIVQEPEPDPVPGNGDDGNIGDNGDNGDGGEGDGVVLGRIVAMPLTNEVDNFPMWLQAAVKLGTKFIRIAAAAIPPATTDFEPKCGIKESSPCCPCCGQHHNALMDEYYFWIETSEYFEKIQQVAEWGASAADPLSDWHREDKLPKLMAMQSNPMVHLRWCRVHNKEFQQPRKSFQGVHVDPSNPFELEFTGRSGDSLTFSVHVGVVPTGIAPPPPAGFRYDIAPDLAVVVPEIIPAVTHPAVGGLTAFPFFAWFDPGAPLLPESFFSPAVATAGFLRSHCRFEEALKWYELIFNPPINNNKWIICGEEDTPDLGPEPDPNNPDGHNINLFDTPNIDVAPPVTHMETDDDNDDDDDNNEDEDRENREKDCCCASEPVPEKKALNRAILLHYLETLLEWSAAVMRKNTPEAFQLTRLIVDTAARILGDMPVTILSKGNTTKVKVTDFAAECAPLNPRLLCIYLTVKDRLSLIHNCVNAFRLKNSRPNIDMPYFGNSTVRECWKLSTNPCFDDGEWCMPYSPYRFTFLYQKALELSNEVKTFGAALLSAYEKGDAEYLQAMRVMHERQLLELALEIRQVQLREADWQVQALQKTKEIAQTNLLYYKNLIAYGLIPNEAQYEPMMSTAGSLRAAGNIVEAIGQFMNLIPDPYVGFPSNFVKLPVGSKLAFFFSAAAKISNTIAEIISGTAALGLVKAGWERREQEWEHQVDVHTIEVEQIERQILAAERRRDTALLELNNHKRQIQNSAEIQDYVRDKFTNHSLYLWMQQETAALHYQMYELAWQCSHQAQKAFNFERGHLARKFLPADVWDNLHEGLLSGEKLLTALRQMEKAYYNENVRDYELTKHFSLRLHFPIAFLQLQTTGYCEINIPEWMYDADYPGHFMRRIKNVTMSIPCVVGPYTGVHCRLTLLSSKTRVDPRLIEPPHVCCHDKHWKNGYDPLPDDPRIISMYAATQAITTSTGQMDSGMFELNFRDERYLPFEFAGAVSRWRIELPLENNQFEMKTLSDVILHINFTAREGGDALRKAANENAQNFLPGSGIRFFNIKNEFPDAWYILEEAMQDNDKHKELGIKLGRIMFPNMASNKQIAINSLEILFEAPNADPSHHHLLQFFNGANPKHSEEEKCSCQIHFIDSVANSEWPGCYHGVVNFKEKLLADAARDIGLFRFPASVGPIKDAYIFCYYEKIEQEEVKPHGMKTVH